MEVHLLSVVGQLPEVLLSYSYYGCPEDMLELSLNLRCVPYWLLPKLTCG